MEWEFAGIQELWSSGIIGKGHAYAPRVWRTHVPGGWLVMAMNGKSNDPQPTLAFYPDPSHLWTIGSSEQADRLLRPASDAPSPSSGRLLRAADEQPGAE